MSDLISRQAAIDALGRRPDAGRFSSNYELGARNQYDMARLALETMPPAEPKVEDVVDLDFNAERLKKIIDHVAELLTSAQPEHPERERGTWKTAYLDHEAIGERPRIFYCSECNQCIAYPVNFCPSCGADMRGSKNE